MNKKGLTLVELIISIALIGVMLIFLFRLLVMLRYDENYSDLNAQMIVSNAEVIKNIENDFIDKGLSSVTCNSSGLDINFAFKDGTNRSLKLVDGNVIVYNSEGRKLPSGYEFGAFSCVSKSSSGGNNLYVFQIDVNDSKKRSQDRYRLRFAYSSLNSDITINTCNCTQK